MLCKNTATKQSTKHTKNIIILLKKREKEREREGERGERERDKQFSFYLSVFIKRS